MKNKVRGPVNYSNLLDRIGRILVKARTKVVREINKAQVMAYWEIGREIVEFEQKGKARGEYGEHLIERLSKDMTPRFGKGISSTNLKMMRLFYHTFPIRQTLSDESVQEQKSQTASGKSETVSRKSSIQKTVPGKFQISRALSDEFEPMLSWSHYCELLKVEEPLARSFYEQEAIQNNWSVRELKRQINSMLFERLALSKDTKAVIKMAKKGENLGRLHRLHDNKQLVQVYDYVDIHIPTLMRMYKKRLKGYDAIGYTIQKENRSSNQQSNQYEYVQREDL